MTNRNYLETLLNMTEVKNFPGMTDWVEHQLELLDKKNRAPKKPNATQIANTVLMDEIFATIVGHDPMTVTEIMRTVPACALLSNQKVSAVMNGMVKENRATKETIKGKTFFAVIAHD